MKQARNGLVGWVFVAVVATLVLLPSHVESQTALSWTRATATGGVAPPNRRDAALEYDPVRGRIVLFGGIGDGGELNDVWVYTVTTSTWSEVTTSGNAPAPRFDMVSGIANDILYVSSGQRGAEVFADVYALNLATNVWTQLPQRGEIPEGRYGSAGGVWRTGQGLYLSHGFDKKVRFDDTFYYSFADQRWWDVTPDGNLPAARCLVGTTMVGPDTFTMFGGCGSGGYAPCPAQDGYVYAANFADGSRNWDKTSNCPGKEQRSAMAPFPGIQTKAILYGGSDAPSDALVSVLDIPTGTWTRVVPGGSAKPAKRQAHAMTLVHTNVPNQFVAMFGGRTGGGLSNDLWFINGDSLSGLATKECEDSFDFRILHGFFMWLSWGIMLPGGIFAARFLKYMDVEVTGKPIWFAIHRVIMPVGLVFALLGFTFAWLITDKHFSALPHAPFGVLVMLLGILQPVNAYFRPHADPFTNKRKIWQYIHWWAGRTAAFLGFINVGLGVWHINRHIFVDLTALWVMYGLFAAFFVIGFLALNVLRGKQDADSKGYPSYHVWIPKIFRELTTGKSGAIESASDEDEIQLSSTKPSSTTSSATSSHSRVSPSGAASDTSGDSSSS